MNNNSEEKHRKDLEAAKNWYKIAEQQNNEVAMNILKDLFSELNENIGTQLVNSIKSSARLENCLQKHGFKIEEVIAWLKKQAKQKSIDKVGPKFKVGDWIVTPNNETKQIEKVTFGNYYFTDKTLYNIIDTDNKGHLWTIQDAKEGDVLYYKKNDYDMEIIVMYLAINIHNNVDSYCRYNSKLGFNTYITNVLSAEFDFITPATKEQRNILLSKMKEAGYEWDAEKKELKKIEHKSLSTEETELNSLAFLTELGYTCIPPTKEKPNGWSEDDEYQINTILHGLDLKRELYKKEGNQVEEKRYKTQYDWLKSIKDRVKPQSKQEWSEEDIKMLSEIVLDLKLLKNKDTGEEGKAVYQREIDWLELIKDRVQPQSNQEWSEKDENMREKLLKWLRFSLGYNDERLQSEAKEMIDWLKSLKPQNHWKPSEEQILSLQEAIDIVGENSISGRNLIEILEQLKNI